MLDIDMIPTTRFALVRATGDLISDDEANTLAAALAFVPDEEDLVVDLTGLHRLTARCANIVGASLLQRAPWSEVAVVSPHDDVTMHLILSEIDHAVPIVHDLRQAANIISARRRTDDGKVAL
ncbi:MAG: hypothetical protein ABI894_09415 [Ilumatobacteraceae bacterium]